MMTTRRTEISIRSNWAKILEVNFKHNYYADGKCKDLEAIPTEATKRFLRNHRLLYRATPSGFTILCNEDKKQDLVDAKLENAKITFLIKVNNRFFVNFSDLPFQHDKSICYFNNVKYNKNEEGEQLLHQEDFVTATLENQLLLVPKVFNYKTNMEVMAEDLQLFDLHGDRVGWTTSETVAKRNHRIDLQSLPEGFYKLSQKRNKDEELQIYCSEDAGGNYFGIVDIFLNNKADKPNRIIDKQTIKEQSFNICFNNRSTYWKYFVIDEKTKVNYNFYEITGKGDGKSRISFSKAEKVYLQNGKSAVQLISKNPIPLLERQSHKFKLNLGSGNGSRMKKFSINLSSPSTKVIKPDRTTKKVYSEIFVTL